MAQNSISQGTLQTDFDINNWPILALKVSKETYWMWLRHSLKVFYQNNWCLRNSGPLKISLFQYYEVLWIHDIDAICTNRVDENFNFSIPFFEYSPTLMKTVSVLFLGLCSTTLTSLAFYQLKTQTTQLEFPL